LSKTVRGRPARPLHSSLLWWTLHPFPNANYSYQRVTGWYKSTMTLSKFMLGSFTSMVGLSEVDAEATVRRPKKPAQCAHTITWPPCHSMDEAQGAADFPKEMPSDYRTWRWAAPPAFAPRIEVSLIRDRSPFSVAANCAKRGCS